MKNKALLIIISSSVLIACGANTDTRQSSTASSSSEAFLKADRCQPQGSILAAERLRVIDGDTVEVIPPEGGSERVRLIGIDAP